MAEAGVESPRTADDYLRQAWKLYAAEKSYFSAEENFRQAIALAPENVDAFYGLGLVLKAQERNQDAIEVFTKVKDLIEAGAISEHNRSEMLHRLTVGHINRLQTGDWNLEKEIWRKGR